MRITVLGAGSWGTTVASLVAERSDTLLWARDPQVGAEVNAEHTHTRYLPGFALPPQLRATDDLERAASHAEVLVVAVPSHAFRDVLVDVRTHLHPWIPVVSLTKGLEQGSLFRMTQVIKDVMPGHPAAALTGPNLAKEVMAGLAAAGVVATEDLSVAAALQRVFGRDLFRVYTHHDVIGCEVGGAMKNVVAIATGMAQGLSVGDNTRAAVISRGLAELTQLGVAMGAEAATLSGLAGLGDLVATCVSPQSRNRYLGEQLGAGRSVADVLAQLGQVAEGAKTVFAAVELADRHGLGMPITRAMHRVVTGEMGAASAYAGLLRSPAGHEAEPG